MISLRLSREEVVFLAEQLERQLTTVENELVHTDARGMQRDLAADLERLRALAARIRDCLEGGEEHAA